MCLVKADAYGHGLKPLAQFFQQADCQMLGCACLQEALLIRQAKVRLPILLLSPPLKSEIPEIVRQGFIMTLSSLAEAETLKGEALKQRKKARCHIKFNTGMNRLGVDAEQLIQLFSYVQEAPALKLEGFYSHYACADSDPAMTKEQWKRFSAIQTPELLRHMDNSAGLFGQPDSFCDMVRPGIAVYGISPFPRFQKQLRPALSWKARITFIKEVARGATLSYGATFRAPKKMLIATVAVGYGDGLFRSLSNNGKVLVNGKRCPIVGRVTMDQLLIDISRAGTVENEAEVVLIGNQKKESILASEMAQDAGTIPYEIWCHITDRVPKVYLNS
jgi:alanine racemase